MKQEKQQYEFSGRVLRDMSSAVLVLDTKGSIVYVNRPASKILEIDEGSEVRPFDSLIDNDYNDGFSDAVLDALYDRDEVTRRRVRFMAASGKKYVLLMTSSYLKAEEEGEDRLVITISDLTEMEQIREKFTDSSMTFSTFLFAFCGWMLVYALWEFLKRPIAADFMTHGVEVMGLIMLIFIIRSTSLTWKDLGIGNDEPGKTVKTALIVAFCAVLFLALLKAGIRLFDPTAFEPDAPFFDISRFGIRQIIYIFTAGIQEFLARSVMQGNLRRISPSKHRGLYAILLSSFIFAALHIHFGFLFMIGSAILAGLEGILYDKQNSLLGVWIVHWAFGVGATLLCLIDH